MAHERWRPKDDFYMEMFNEERENRLFQETRNELPGLDTARGAVNSQGQESIIGVDQGSVPLQVGTPLEQNSFEMNYSTPPPQQAIVINPIDFYSHVDYCLSPSDVHFSSQGEAFQCDQNPNPVDCCPSPSDDYNSSFEVGDMNYASELDQFDNQPTELSEDMHSHKPYENCSFRADALGYLEENDFRIVESHQQHGLPPSISLESEPSTYTAIYPSAGHTKTPSYIIAVCQRNDLSAYINFSSTVAKSLALSPKNVRNFIGLVPEIQRNGFHNFPSSTKNIKQKMKQYFRERRLKHALDTWKTLQENFQSTRTVDLRIAFPGANLSEEFSRWAPQYLTERLNRNAKNAGTILEMQGNDRRVFMAELERVHLLEHGTKLCEFWFGSLFSLGDIEMSVFWVCHCTDCKAAFPEGLQFTHLRGAEYVSKVYIETFRLEFTKFKARQFNEILVAHSDPMFGIANLYGQPLFSGWDKNGFDSALVHAHDSSCCSVCSPQTSRKRVAPSQQEIPRRKVKRCGGSRMAAAKQVMALEIDREEVFSLYGLENLLGKLALD